MAYSNVRSKRTYTFSRLFSPTYLHLCPTESENSRDNTSDQNPISVTFSGKTICQAFYIPPTVSPGVRAPVASVAFPFSRLDRHHFFPVYVYVYAPSFPFPPFLHPRAREGKRQRLEVSLGNCRERPRVTTG